MPSSWSMRLLSSGSSANTATPNGSSSNPRDKSLPRTPQEQAQVFFDPPPTLQPDRTAPSPPRPHTTGGARHSHGRSISHPLPKIFGRKKSAHDLGFNDTDIPLDGGTTPGLDDLTAPTPTRVISGKKASKVDDEGDKVARRCMCCDSRVSVPKALEKFRCLACLTINDLKPLTDQKDSDKELGRQGGDEKPPETLPGRGPPKGRALPLSVERTRAIIDRCLMTYLEARCRKHEELPPSPKKASSSITTSMTRDGSTQTAKQLTDAPVSSSPPDTPGLKAIEPLLAPSAIIGDLPDTSSIPSHWIDPSSSDQKNRTLGPSPSMRAPERKPVPSPVPAKPRRKPPPPPPTNLAGRTLSERLHPNGSFKINGEPPSPRPPPSPRLAYADMEQRKHYDRVKTIFRPLEDYMVASFGDFRCLNTSFSTVRPMPQGRTRSESTIGIPPPEVAAGSHLSPFDGFSELDAKTLLLGDLGENSSWWTGKLDRLRSEKGIRRKAIGEGAVKTVSSRSPNINWVELIRWYDVVHSAGKDWHVKADQLKSNDAGFLKDNLEGSVNIESINEELAEAREHVVRTLLKITENVLKRPSQPLKEPEHLRFLLILLTNPSLYPSNVNRSRAESGASNRLMRTESETQNGVAQSSPKHTLLNKSPSRGGSQHNGLLKRIFGLLSHSSDNCHRYLIGWFARFDEDHFVRIVDLVASFVTHRLARRSNRPRSRSAVTDGGLIPDFSGGAMSTSAQLHSAMGLSGSVKKRNHDGDNETDWASDWQIKAAAKLMSLLFAANNIWQGKRRDPSSPRVDSGLVPVLPQTPPAKARTRGQLLHTSTFYNTLLDYHDLIADFKVWESKREKFAFCQYPLFLSMGAKIKILEYDARRQMESKAREAYFDQVIRQRAIDGHFHLRIRRECMVDDSLRQISEAVGAGQEELKKGLRVHFTGEEGVDAGGPRKEWFLMLVRDIFDPNHGMFVYDDESHLCYFNPNSFETSDQYYLVGALLGLAIYNSTILDIALPPFAFRRLLAAAPSSSASNASNIASLTGTKGQMTYSVADLAEFRPSLAAGLQQLLDFEGDVETTYCRDFVAPVERYGVVTNIPLVSNGEGTPVTNANRHEFVDAYVRYLLDTSVARQFEPFKRGFFTVCAGNALSLFRAEEIELLVRGSAEPLNVDSLRAVAVYENWRHFQPPHPPLPHPADTVPVVAWFWDLFAQASPARQRQLLTFITGTDRIPAVGATSLVLRIVAGGDGWGGGGAEERARFPVARTCFNMLVLWRYDYREALEEKLWRAVEESEGFGLK